MKNAKVKSFVKITATHISNLIFNEGIIYIDWKIRNIIALQNKCNLRRFVEIAIKTPAN
jgi:hypothetical protein